MTACVPRVRPRSCDQGSPLSSLEKQTCPEEAHRSRAPERVHQEIWFPAISYNLVRLGMAHLPPGPMSHRNRCSPATSLSPKKRGRPADPLPVSRRLRSKGIYFGIMDQDNSGLRSLLSSPMFFNLLQNIVGAGRFRRVYVREFIRPAPGARILDIGCGTGAILDHLPREIEYEGYDLAQEYIEYAQRKYAERGRFFCERVSRLSIRQPHSFDIVLASALLHHLNDEEAKDLFRIAGLSLKPGGVLITYDNIFIEGQSRLARYFISQDRGQHVRTPSQYETLARTVFGRIETATRHNLLRIPYTHFFMTCSQGERPTGEDPPGPCEARPLMLQDTRERGRGGNYRL